MKNGFLLDELYVDNKEYPKDKSYVERFLYYKFQTDDIDADVCKSTVNRYCQQYYFLKGAVVENQGSSANKYQIRSPIGVFRGETLVNCMELLKQIVNLFADDNGCYTNADIRDNKGLLLDNVFYKENEELINEFVSYCYCSGNFLPIPYCKGKSLNRAKGRLYQPGYNSWLRDSSDIYLQVLSDYFTEQYTGEKLTSYIDECDAYYEWKMRYLTKGSNEGVLRFIEEYHLRGFFEGAKPKVFWKLQDNPSGGIIEYMESVNRALGFRAFSVAVDEYYRNLLTWY